jgi:hypothetical protein
MIEMRGSLLKDKRFEGGFSLKRGTVIYVRETEAGWLGMYYEDTGSGHGFALEPDDFSIWQSPDINAEEMIVIPEPPQPEEDREAERQLARRRVQSRIRKHREEADALEKMLAEEVL